MELNLARLPFVNQRPLRRIGLFLAVLGLGLAVVNGLLYWNHYAGASDTQGDLVTIDAEIDDEREQLVELDEALERFEVDDLNEKVEFANRQIAHRVFSWSRLFDRLVEALPGDVRLLSLTPRFADTSARGRRRRPEVRSNEVSLEIRGSAKSGEELLLLVDKLFAHGSFRDPDLRNEARQPGGLFDFALSVTYDPRLEIQSGPPQPEENSDGDVAVEPGGST